MDKDLRYPVGGYWEAVCKRHAQQMAMNFQKLMLMNQVKVNSDYPNWYNGDYDAKLDIGNSVIIKFIDNDAGSILKIRIVKEDKDLELFLATWQQLINRMDVFDGYFKIQVIDPGSKTIPLLMPWEHIGNDEENITLTFPLVRLAQATENNCEGAS